MKIGLAVRNFRIEELTMLPRTVYELSKFLVARGNEVTIISEDERVSPGTSWLEGGPKLRVVESLHQYIRGTEYDIWHFFGSILGGVLFLANLPRGRCFLSLYSFKEGWGPIGDFRFLRISDITEDNRVLGFLKRFLEESLVPNLVLRHYLGSCEKVVVPSIRSMGFYSTLLGRQKVEMVFHGLDFKRFSNYDAEESSRLRDQLRILPEDRVILYLGHSYLCRGVDDTIFAFPLVREEISNAKLVLVLRAASPSSMNYIKTLARKNFPSNTFRIVESYVANPQDYYGMADVVVLPYRISWELAEYPFVLLEAMAAGKPVVTTPIGAIPEIIRNGKTGLFVKPKDYRTLAGGIIDVLTDSSLAAKIGSGAQDLVKEFDWVNFCSKISRLYGLK